MSRRLLRVGPKLALPALEAQTQTLVIYGGKGMGKTNFGSVFVEELDKQGLRFAWLDPVGVAWGLKHDADGRGEGIALLILGGIHGDLPIEPTAGAIVADLVVDEDVSVLIDISRKPSGEMWGQGEKIRFVRDYCLRLFQRQGERRRPIMQVIDEAGRFVPQQAPKGAVDIAECTGAIEQLVELGRNVGVGVTLLTQRSARMNKSVSELAEMMIAFRTVGPRSIDAIVDWFGEHVPKSQWREYVETVRQLDRGTALVVSPGWLGVEGEFATRARETFDSSDTPVAGRERRPRGKGAKIDNDKYLRKMALTIEKAKADDPRELRKQLHVGKERVRRAEAELARMAAELERRPIESPEPQVVPVVPDFVASRIVDIQGLARVADEQTRQVFEDIGRLRADVESFEPDRGSRTFAAPARATPPPASPSPRPAPPRPTPGTPGTGSSPFGSDGEVTAPERRILDALAWLDAVGFPQPTKIQIGFIAGYRVGKKIGGNFANLLGQLKGKELIAYPVPGHAALTDAGRAAATVPDIERTTEGLQRAIFARLDAPEQRVLSSLVNAYPEPLSKQQVGTEAGYTVGDKIGGNFANLLGRLRSLGLIDYPVPGMAVALPVLFLEPR